MSSQILSAVVAAGSLRTSTLTAVMSPVALLLMVALSTGVPSVALSNTMRLTWAYRLSICLHSRQ